MPARLLQFFDAAFGRYAVTSATATATDFVVFSGLHALGVAPGTATFFGCVAGGIVSFSLCRRWTFQAGSRRALPQVLRFLFAWATSALLNSVGVPALLAFVRSPALAWVLVRAAAYLGWNYPLSRWFVFAAEKPDAALSAP